MIVYKDLEQGSHEWLQARLIKITGTSLDEVMGTPYAKIKLVCRLIAEELTEQAKSFKASAEMERGSAEEIFAIKRYEKEKGIAVDRVGFLLSEEFPLLGCSPDGMVEVDGKYKGAVEVKSPDSQTSVFYQLSNMVDLGLAKSYTPFCGIPNDYKWQVINYFIVNDDLEWLDFLVYDERITLEDKKLYTVRVERKNPMIQMAIEEGKGNLREFTQMYKDYRKLFIKDDF